MRIWTKQVAKKRGEEERTYKCKGQAELMRGKEGEKATNMNNFFSQKGTKNVGAIIEVKEWKKVEDRVYFILNISSF